MVTVSDVEFERLRFAEDHGLVIDAGCRVVTTAPGVTTDSLLVKVVTLIGAPPREMGAAGSQ